MFISPDKWAFFVKLFAWCELGFCKILHWLWKFYLVKGKNNLMCVPFTFFLSRYFLKMRNFVLYLQLWTSLLVAKYTLHSNALKNTCKITYLLALWNDSAFLQQINLLKIRGWSKVMTGHPTVAPQIETSVCVISKYLKYYAESHGVRTNIFYMQI